MSLITIIAYHPTGYELRIGVTFEELSSTLRRLSARGYTPTREPGRRAAHLSPPWRPHAAKKPQRGSLVFPQNGAS